MEREATGEQAAATTPGARSWPAYAAAAWAFLFALVSFYWAAGGTIGISTLAVSLQELGRERDPVFVAEVWLTGALKLLAGLLALALVRPWGRRLPQRPLRLAAWATGVLLVLYGGSNLVQAILIELGVIGVPKSMGAAAVRWYLFLWEPWWVLGGLLFLAAAWATRTTIRPG